MIKDLINSSSRRCWVSINRNETACFNLELTDSLTETKKHPSASVKPANQFKSGIIRGCLGLKTGTISGKASFNWLDKPKLILFFSRAA